MLPKPLLTVITRALRRGEVGIIPTDTIYGIVGKALERNTVQQIYRLRKRNPKKPMIILVGGMRALARFGITLDAQTKKFLRQVWPGAVSVILRQNPARRAAIKKFSYLHRGTETLAFRLPRSAWLRTLLRITGPLVAPSANVEGKPPAQTIREAKKYFGENVSFYLDVGKLNGRSSTLVAVRDHKVIVLRKGAGRIDKKLAMP